MTPMLLAAPLGVAGLILAATMASAAPQCGTRTLVLGQLTEKYGETLHGMGIANNNAVMEVYASPSSGSWTITVTLPDGRMCLVASGQGYQPGSGEQPAKGRKI